VSISQEELFRIALGLEKPWYIKTIDFKVEEKQLDLHIDFDSGSKFPCPSCGRSGCHVHDTIERTWASLELLPVQNLPALPCSAHRMRRLRS
jgi:transposase